VTDKSSEGDYEVGHRKPPSSTRFEKGQSGNPRGRPRGRHKLPPYEAVLGQKVTIRENGIERQVTASEAFLLHMIKQGLEGDIAAAGDVMTAIEGAHAIRQELGIQIPQRINLVFVSPGNVNSALESLRMARKLDRYRETARMALEPWLVETALGRLGGRRLSVEEQKTVVQATRTPWKVRWPDWWSVLPARNGGPK
jgi:Family of unknown function (DUF5681)